MPTKTSMLGRGFGLLGRLLLVALALCGITGMTCFQGTERQVYDVTPRRLTAIPPGTVIERGPPQGWSHLVIKSQPRIGSGDVNLLPGNAPYLASFLQTTVLANVEADNRGAARHRISGVAVGLATRVGDRDVIITPQTQHQLGANLGFLARIVLTKAHDKLQETRLVARSDTMVLLDAAGLIAYDGRHRDVILRYALLADAATDRLEALVWRIDCNERGDYAGAVGPIEWLAASAIDDCVLNVDGREISLGMPSDRAFAMNRIPKGRTQIEMVEDLKASAGRARPPAEAAADLEARLRAS